MTKKVVLYTPGRSDFIQVGLRALVVPVDHPDTESVTNGLSVMTSTVESYDPHTGEFETTFSRYVPKK